MTDPKTHLLQLGPDLFLIPHPQWEPFAERETEAAYEKLDNLLEQARIPVDVVAGALYNPREKRMYADAAIMEPALDRNEEEGRELSKHEYGHYKGQKHPTDAIRGFFHALVHGFNYRAFTRVLRRRTKPEPPGWSAWWDEARRLRRLGLIQPQDAPAKTA